MPDEQNQCRGEVVVKLADPLTLPLVTSRYGLRVLDQLATRPIYRMQITNPASSIQSTIKALLASGLVVYAEANYIGQVPEGVGRGSWAVGGDDGMYHTQWAPSVLRLPEAHTVSRGAGVTVAVLDTGADLDHPALARQLVQGIDFVGGDLDPSEEGVYGQDIGFGHGTHVAGLVALVAPEASIMPLRILHPDGRGNSWLLAEGIRYAAANGASVINISYTVLKHSRLIEELLAEATAPVQGTVVVAAAGNNGPSTAKEYPAAEDVDGLVSVAASTETDELTDFSTRGRWVRVMAPGVHILSTVPDNTYGTWSGTSMAAPLTAGTAALVRSNAPGLAPEQVVQRLVKTAVVIAGAVRYRIDAAAAMGL